MTTPVDLVTAALAHAARGWYVFPLVPDSKRPAVDRWETRATRDPDRIGAAWNSGSYGIGLACGPSGLLVLDLDRPKPGQQPPPAWHRDGITDGLDVLAALCEQAGQPLPPATYTVATPSGGRHLYYAQPTGMQLRNSHGERGGFGWLIDTRGHGGYVAAPGTTIDGRAYSVVNDGSVPELPGWLVDQLAATAATGLPTPDQVQLRSQRVTPYVEKAIATQTAHVRAAGEGKRNFTLYMAAQNLGQLVAGGMVDAATVQHALLTAAEAHLAAGAYTRREAHDTIRSGLKAGAKRPRRVAA